MSGNQILIIYDLFESRPGVSTLTGGVTSESTADKHIGRGGRRHHLGLHADLSGRGHRDSQARD